MLRLVRLVKVWSEKSISVFGFVAETLRLCSSLAT